MSVHRPVVVPSVNGYHALCSCGYTTATVREILVAQWFALSHRRWEGAVDEIIRDMDARGFLVALEDL